MDILIDIGIIALSVSFVLGAIDAFIDLKKTKGFIALLFSIGFLYIIGYYGLELVILAPASAFSSLAIILLLEKPVNITTTRRY
jgi:ABC-type bacteriocin/lantibiotic exporter with double-glycine peptidase domain